MRWGFIMLLLHKKKQDRSLAFGYSQK